MKINIIRQDSLKYRRIRLARRINVLVTFGSIGIFSAAILYMTSYFIFLGIRQNNLTKTVNDLKRTYSGRVGEVADYLAVKEIVAAINDQEAKKFRYKEFLNAIFALLPGTAVLSSVDFGAPGVVLAGVRLTNLNDYEALRGKIDQSAGKSGFLFNSISQKQMVRDESGSYLITLELRFKNGS